MCLNRCEPPGSRLRRALPSSRSIDSLVRVARFAPRLPASRTTVFRRGSLDLTGRRGLTRCESASAASDLPRPSAGEAAPTGAAADVPCRGADAKRAPLATPRGHRREATPPLPPEPSTHTPWLGARHRPLGTPSVVRASSLFDPTLQPSDTFRSPQAFRRPFDRPTPHPRHGAGPADLAATHVASRLAVHGKTLAHDLCNRRPRMQPPDRSSPRGPSAGALARRPSRLRRSRGPSCPKAARARLATTGGVTAFDDATTTSAAPPRHAPGPVRPRTMGRADL